MRTTRCVRHRTVSEPDLRYLLYKIFTVVATMDAGKQERKAYAMMRMAQAIGRAIDAPSTAEKDRAARWAAAWGLIGGIMTPGVRLRRSLLADRGR